MAWNASDSGCNRAESVPAKNLPAKTPNVLRGAIAGGVVMFAIIAMLCYLFCGEEADSPISEVVGQRGAISDGNPDLRQGGDMNVSNSASSTPVAKEPEYVIPPGYVAVTNGEVVVIMTPEEAETFRRACRDTTLRTRTEKHLSLLATIPVGSPVPPMPPMTADEMDKDVVDTLINKIEILPDDTEREVEQKEFVIAFKEYLREEIKNGKKPSEVYREYVKIMNDVAYLTTEGARKARALMAEGDEEGARAFAEIVNKKIESLGIGTGTIDLDRRGPRGAMAPAPGR